LTGKSGYHYQDEVKFEAWLLPTFQIDDESIVLDTLCFVPTKGQATEIQKQ
jgi:hypothetical protein